ncbi:MAG TPA: hypothetical protein DCG72_06300 [Gammaproteobacteria bacterium]|nr:hypothetical protein [Gammaproteobacteria bacterium]
MSNSPTSKAAYNSIKDSLEKREAAVLKAVQGRPSRGITLDEFCAKTGATPNAVSGRFTSLLGKGIITKSGTRPSRSGRASAIYYATV